MDLADKWSVPYCPVNANRIGHAPDGDTATISCGRVGHLVRFPLVRIASRPIRRRVVRSQHRAETSPIGGQIVPSQ